MKKSLILMIMLVIPTLCYADEWTKEDTMFQAGYSVLHVMDWGQTLTIAKNPDKWNESNPILGEHPSQSKVNLYFASTLVGHALVSYILPKPYRKIWQGVWIGIEAGYVVHNFKAGIGINF